MNDFYLAEAKNEGENINMTRRIELHYDPDKKTGHLPIDQIRFALQDCILCNNLSQNDITAIITDIANEFIEEDF